MKRAPRSRQRHDLYAKYHDYDSEISDLLGECGLKRLESESGLDVYETTRDQVRRALEAAGIVLLSTVQGQGVLLVDDRGNKPNPSTAAR